MTTTEAQTAVARLQEEKARAVAELAAAREALDALETSAGDRLLTARLDNDEAAAVSIRSELTEARAAVADLEAIITASDRAIQDAEKAVLVATAADLRRQAAERWEEAEKRLQATAERLGQLRKTEGVRWMPWPSVEASGAVAAGSWRQTATGRLLAEILDLEHRAAGLERRSGATPGASILPNDPAIALHLGSPGVVQAVATGKANGSQLDAASAKLAGREIPKTPEPTAAEIAAAWGNPIVWRGAK